MKQFNDYDPKEYDLAQKARRALSLICKGRFSMSIPPQESDIDMTIARLIEGYEILSTRNEVLTLRQIEIIIKALELFQKKTKRLSWVEEQLSVENPFLELEETTKKLLGKLTLWKLNRLPPVLPESLEVTNEKCISA